MLKRTGSACSSNRRVPTTLIAVPLQARATRNTSKSHWSTLASSSMITTTSFAELARSTSCGDTCSAPSALKGDRTPPLDDDRLRSDAKAKLWGASLRGVGATGRGGT